MNATITTALINGTDTKVDALWACGTCGRAKSTELLAVLCDHGDPSGTGGTIGHTSTATRIR